VTLRNQLAKLHHYYPEPGTMPRDGAGEMSSGMGSQCWRPPALINFPYALRVILATDYQQTVNQSMLLQPNPFPKIIALC